MKELRLGWKCKTTFLQGWFLSVQSVFLKSAEVKKTVCTKIFNPIQHSLIRVYSFFIWILVDRYNTI